MKRWLPYLAIVVGLAGLLAGWLLYPPNVRDGANCQISALYRELQGGSSCYRGFGDLYASLVLLVISVPLVLGAGTRALSRYAPRLRPQAHASLLVVALLLVGTVVRFSWHSYEEHRNDQRRQAAEKVLAAMQLPNGWVAGRANQCPDRPTSRCAQSDKSVEELAKDLAALLRGPAGFNCAPARADCPVATVEGEINGYRAMGSVTPNVYSYMDGPTPPRAVQLPRRGTSKPSYQDGSMIQVYLLPIER